GQQRRRALGVVGQTLDVWILGPRAGAERAGGLAAETEHDTVQQLLLVDRVREGPAHAAVGEARILEVEAQVGIARSRVPELVVGLLERRVLGLALVLERRERRDVDALGLQLEEDRGLARDDAVD